MPIEKIHPSKHVRKQVQLGLIPAVIGTLYAEGHIGLIKTLGVAEAILLLGALILIQIYLIAARFKFDFQGVY